MRRFDREITDSAQIRAFLCSEQIMRVAFCDGEEIYIVPVNYGVCTEQNRYIFYFHGAKAGRKYELAKASPKVGFEIDGRFAVCAGETACDFSAKYMSVIGTGMLTLVTDRAEKIAGLQCLMRHVTGSEQWTYSDARIDGTAVYRLEAETLSCKAKL